ncbi:hypothetical protein H4Q26_010430 [Puccinia striiformis f. sp. tritici PST-130]|nr:hypothetical protein H4Q26_010430 [Puccinia striiformis f. sp. tritici PST-130]
MPTEDKRAALWDLAGKALSVGSRSPNHLLERCQCGGNSLQVPPWMASSEGDNYRAAQLRARRCCSAPGLPTHRQDSNKEGLHFNKFDLRWRHELVGIINIAPATLHIQHHDSYKFIFAVISLLAQISASRALQCFNGNVNVKDCQANVFGSRRMPGPLKGKSNQSGTLVVTM